jgi:hypothetical protein
VPAQRPPGHGDRGIDPLSAPAEALGLPPRHPAAVDAPPSAPAQPGGSGRLPGGEASAGWPCAACGSANAFTAGVCGSCGSAFLSDVRQGEAPLLSLPVVGDITKLQRSHRLGLAFLVMLVIVLVTALLMLLVS